LIQHIDSAVWLKHPFCHSIFFSNIFEYYNIYYYLNRGTIKVIQSLNKVKDLIHGMDKIDYQNQYKGSSSFDLEIRTEYLKNQ